MPVKTGWDVIQYLREQPGGKELPIVAVTGMSASLEEHEKVKTLCDDILLKSDFDLDKFLGTVNGLLEKGRG